MIKNKIVAAAGHINIKATMKEGEGKVFKITGMTCSIEVAITDKKQTRIKNQTD
jgi:hypothetical protein